jgi:hypothetical protein
VPVWENRPFTPLDVAVTIGIGVLAGLSFGYAVFLLGVYAIGLPSSAAFRPVGVVTVGTSVVSWKFLWSEFYGPNAAGSGP